MLALGIILGTIAVVGLLALVAGADTRDGNDWERHSSGSSYPMR